MGGKSSKSNSNRQSSYYASSAVAIVDPSANGGSAGDRGKSERQENDENRAKRVGMICRWITDCDIESEMEDFMKQLRDLCGEMTARLFAPTELQAALVAESEKIVYATAKAMNQFPENDSILLESLEILDFMEVTDWDGKRGASKQAELVIRVIESTLTKNQENDRGFAKEDIEKLRLCVDILSHMAECHREELSKTNCSRILLKTLKSLPDNARRDFRSIGYLVAERLTPKEELSVILPELIETMLKDGLTACHLAEKRWGDVDESYLSPLLAAYLTRGDVDVNSGCSSSGKTALIVASETSQLGAMSLLFEKGASIEKSDKQGRTPLMAAIGKRQSSAVKLLLERGAKVDAVDNEKRNPVHFAVKKNEPEILCALLAKCDQNKKDVVNARDSAGLTPLLVIVWGKGKDETKSLQCLNALVEAGSDVEVAAPNGASALILAVHCRRDISIIRRLVEVGCNKVTNCQGMTAFDVANEEGADPEEMEILRV